MRIGKYFSIVSIVIALIIVLLKLQYDIEVYHTISDVLSSENPDSSPTLITIGLKFILMILFSLILSFIGFKKKNKYRKPALIMNVIAFVYLLFPIGFLLILI